MLKFTLEEAVKIARFVGGDGWSIVDGEKVAEELGIAPEKITRLAHTYEGGPGKYMIYDSDGQPVRRYHGVHLLTLVECAAQDVGADPGWFEGRGFRARAASEAILKLAGQ